MGDFSTLGIRLKELRSKLNKTQKEFAQMVGCTAATLSAYENGSKSPSLEIVKNIAEKCDVSMDWLCGLSDQEYQSMNIETYSDLIKIIFKINEKVFLDITLEEGDPFNQKSFENKVSLGISDIDLFTFFYEWEKMRVLYYAQTIDKEVYDLWIEKTLKKFDKELPYLGFLTIDDEEVNPDDESSND